MKITLYGVRGSIPVPGKDTVKYGGNTTCIGLETPEGDQIIFDGGTGIRVLGMTLIKQLPVKCALFITHTHWDHIQGLPFFTPFFIPGSEVNIYGSFDPIYRKDLKTILSNQMEYCYFPVRECELNAQIQYNHVIERQPITVGSATITPILLNHPVLNYGYKVECHKKTFFFTGDYEPPYNIYDPDDHEFSEYETLLQQQRGQLADFIKHCDLVVADSQYSSEEYPSKKGWGHGSYDTCIQLAKEAQIKHMVMTHHDPLRTDAQLEQIWQDFSSRTDLPQNTKFELAIEGKSFVL